MLSAATTEREQNSDSEYGSDGDSGTLYSTSDEDDAKSFVSYKSGILRELMSGLIINQNNRPPPPVPSHIPKLSIIEKESLKSLFAEADSPDNIILDGEGQIIAASIFKLVERLTSGADVTFAEEFLLSFRLFTTPLRLLELLCFRLEQSFLDSNMENSDQQNQKLRTFIVLREWLKEYFDVDFKDSVELRTTLLNCLDQIRGRSHNLSLSDQQIIIKLKKLIRSDHQINEESKVNIDSDVSTIGAESTSSYKQREKEGLLKKFKRFFRSKSVTDDSSVEVSSISTAGNLTTNEKYKHSCLCSESSDALCEQITLIEAEIFHSIDWRDLLNYPDSTNNSIKHSVDHFNGVCQWIINEINHSPTQRIQTQILRKLIRIAMKCVGHNNFNTAMQIILALQHPTVEGKETTWKKLPDHEMEIFEELVDFVSPLKNFRNLRRAMELQTVSSSPCIPFTGLILADLAGNKERSSIAGEADATGLIPWYKLQFTAKAIQMFRLLQSPNRTYSFSNTLPELRCHLRTSIEQAVEDVLL